MTIGELVPIGFVAKYVETVDAAPTVVGSGSRLSEILLLWGVGCAVVIAAIVIIIAWHQFAGKGKTPPTTHLGGLN